MSPIAAGLDGLLALLLVAALALGVRLNARLKTLRDGQAGFAAAVLELNQAAARAEAGLNALKSAQEEVHDDLLTRIETARGLASRLERAGAEAERRATVPSERAAEPALRTSAPASSGAPAPGGALAAIAALAEGRTPSRRASAADRTADRQTAADPLAELRASPPPRAKPARGAFDEELFEAKPPRRDDPLGLAALDRAQAPSAPLKRAAPTRRASPAEPAERPATAAVAAEPLDLGPLESLRPAESRPRPDPLRNWKAVR